MRKIKFRGFGMSDKRWHYGSLGIYMSGKCIIGGFGVYPDSVGQYTGLKDRESAEIYEGDIVEVGDFKYSIHFENGSFELVRCSDETDMYLEFDNCWNDDVYPLCQLHWESDAEEDVLYNLKIIGNTYENQE